jgi:xanthine/CO dehydrogenase XdhC/CoxF family maturation factor
MCENEVVATGTVKFFNEPENPRKRATPMVELEDAQFGHYFTVKRHESQAIAFPFSLGGWVREHARQLQLVPGQRVTLTAFREPVVDVAANTITTIYAVRHIEIVERERGACYKLNKAPCNRMVQGRS